MRTKNYRVEPGAKVRLSRYDPRDSDGFDGAKDAGKAAQRDLTARLRELQRVLFAENKQKVLIVLQGMDTSGKDGTVRHVFTGVNPVGVAVANFKKPSTIEREHDYLWRVHHHTPQLGEIVVFNRSHYEDVLVVRVHDLVPRKVWDRRYQHINDFERMLADEGCTILKFFLHISRDKQAERLQERLDNPAKNWKFEHGDVDERKRWDDYIDAYETVLSRTSTSEAPWYVVPSDRKWYRNLVVSQILVDALEQLDMRYPPPAPGLDDIVIPS